MTLNGWFQILLFLAAILAVTAPLGRFMTRVFNREKNWLDPVLRPVERLIYKATGVDETKDMRWTDNSLGSNFNLDWSGMNQYFGSGQTAMYPSGSDVLTALVQSDGVDPKDYGLGLIPTEGDNSGVLSGGNVAVVSAAASPAEKAAAVKWIDFYYMQKLLDKSAAVADAKSLISNKQPVGVPQLPIFDKAQLDTSLGWIDSYINVPKENVAPFQNGIFDQKIIAEPAKHTQELYAALDSVVQAVLTDKNADIDALLKGVNTQIQALIDADAK